MIFSQNVSDNKFQKQNLNLSGEDYVWTGYMTNKTYHSWGKSIKLRMTIEGCQLVGVE